MAANSDQDDGGRRHEFASELRREPQGGDVTKPREPGNDKTPREKPPGPRTPYPVEHPGIGGQPGAEPDYIPGQSPETLPKM
ncbi:MAG: hypothetical protein QOG38_2993 [Hyphomicrobiales bacterium]|jgi:hypothetical protein|nr:hypothetical protein [Hyphomicrobiales bacterium]